MDFLILMVIVAAATLGLMLFLMPKFIAVLNARDYYQEVSEYAIKEYREKAKTPAMGGLLFVLVPTVVIFVAYPTIFHDLKALMVLVSYILFSIIGFLDDFLIIAFKNNAGLNPKLKLLLQLIFAGLIYLFFHPLIDTRISLASLDFSFDLGLLYIPFMILLYAAEANAVNFTDGMDGLCAGVSAIALVPFFILAIFKNEYDIALIIMAVFFGLLGYLKFNRAPAKIYMGDSGSLALGALFTALAIILKEEIALFFIGGVFVVEMFCVCLQLSFVKLFHRRVFLYTPIHYAFRLKGMSDKKVIRLFYIMGIIFAIIGLLVGLL